MWKNNRWVDPEVLHLLTTYHLNKKSYGGSTLARWLQRFCSLNFYLWSFFWGGKWKWSNFMTISAAYFSCTGGQKSHLWPLGMFDSQVPKQIFWNWRSNPEKKQMVSFHFRLGFFFGLGSHKYNGARFTKRITHPASSFFTSKSRCGWSHTC